MVGRIQMAQVEVVVEIACALLPCCATDFGITYHLWTGVIIKYFYSVANCLGSIVESFFKFQFLLIGHRK